MKTETFMFTTGMLSELMGGNRQYISKKIKKLMEDPEVNLKAVLKSNKEGYQISEEEVLRCFDGITPGMVQKYKENYLSMELKPKIKKLTNREEHIKEMNLDDKGIAMDLQKETERLIEWKIKLASTKKEQKNSLEMRAYLENEIKEIEELKNKKLKEYNMLEMFMWNCDKVIDEINQKLQSL